MADNLNKPELCILFDPGAGGNFLGHMLLRTHYAIPYEDAGRVFPLRNEFHCNTRYSYSSHTEKYNPDAKFFIAHFFDDYIIRNLCDIKKSVYIQNDLLSYIMVYLKRFGTNEIRIIHQQQMMIDVYSMLDHADPVMPYKKLAEHMIKMELDGVVGSTLRETIIDRFEIHPKSYVAETIVPPKFSYLFEQYMYWCAMNNRSFWSKASLSSFIRNKFETLIAEYEAIELEAISSHVAESAQSLGIPEHKTVPYYDVFYGGADIVDLELDQDILYEYNKNNLQIVADILDLMTDADRAHVEEKLDFKKYTSIVPVEIYTKS